MLKLRSKAKTQLLFCLLGYILSVGSVFISAYVEKEGLSFYFGVTAAFEFIISIVSTILVLQDSGNWEWK